MTDEKSNKKSNGLYHWTEGHAKKCNSKNSTCEVERMIAQDMEN
jgi:hypothetical protein